MQVRVILPLILWCVLSGCHEDEVFRPVERPPLQGPATEAQVVLNGKDRINEHWCWLKVRNIGRRTAYNVRVGRTLEGAQPVDPPDLPWGRIGRIRIACPDAEGLGWYVPLPWNVYWDQQPGGSLP